MTATAAVRLDAARRMITAPLYRFFQAEWTNEHDGGVSPATLSSAIDSLHQGGPDLFGLDAQDVTDLLLIRDYVKGRTYLHDLAADNAETAARYTTQGA